MKIKNGFSKCKVGDGYLVVTTGELSRTNSIMIELNETSSDIWDLIEKGYDEEKIADKLVKKYSVDKETALSDVIGLIAKMTDAGIFE